MGAWRIAMVAALALPVFPEAAEAQLVRDPEVVKTCLCKEQSVAALDDEVQAQSRAYEEKRQAFEALDKQVQTTRSEVRYYAEVNVKSQAEIDAYKQLLERRDAAADALAGPANQSYAEVVQRYNEAVADYNGSCAGKIFDPDQLAEMKRALSCAKP